MTASPSEIDKIAAAMVRVQAEIKVAKKDRANPFFKSKYADLGAVWEACHEALTNNGIAVIQRTNFRDGVHLLTTDLLHVSGQSISGDYLLRPVKDDPQGIGSAVTYARRYSLAAMVGIIQEDDDGRIASLTRGTKANTNKVADKLKAAVGSGDCIDAGAVKVLVNAWRTAGIKDAEVAEYLRQTFGVTETKKIRLDQHGKILDWIKSKAL